MVQKDILDHTKKTGLTQLGISRLKRLLTEDLTRAFTTNEIMKFIRDIHQNLDLYALTGYPQNSSIPRKEAARSIVNYFHKINRINLLINLYIKTAREGFKGEKIVFNNLKRLITELPECGLQYNASLAKVVRLDNNNSNDWGFLESGKVYNFCFISVDIAGNSQLVRTYNPELVRKSYQHFKDYIMQIIKDRNGRIWSWEGDGGLLAFHINDPVNNALLSAIELLSSMPVFNAIKNLVGDPLRIRLAIHAGNCKYSQDTATINSDTITRVREVEKKFTEEMTISVTKPTFPHIDINLRNHFSEKCINGESVYQLCMPIWSTS